MALIPKFKQRNRSTVVSQNTGISPGALGATGRALQRLGAQGTKFAADLLSKRKKIQTDKFVHERRTETHLELQKRELELKRQTPADGTGYSEAYSRVLKSVVDRNASGAPTEDARQAYLRSVRPLLLRASVNADSYENERKTEAAVTGISERVNKNANHFVSYPDPDVAADQFLNDVSYIRNASSDLFTKEQAEQLVNQTRSAYAKAILDGLDARGDDGDARLAVDFLSKTDDSGAKKPPSSVEIDIGEALEEGFIDEKQYDALRKKGKTRADVKLRAPDSLPKEKTVAARALMDGLSASEKARYLKRFNRKLEKQNKANLGDLRSDMRDLKAAYLDGVEVPDSQFLRIRNELLNSDLDNEVKARKLDELTAGKMAGIVAQEIQDMPQGVLASNAAFEKEIENLESDFDSNLNSHMVLDPETASEIKSKTFNRSIRNQYKRALRAKRSQILQLRQKDPAAFVLKTDPSLQNAAIALDGDILNTSAEVEEQGLGQDFVRKVRSSQKALGISSTNQRKLPRALSSTIADQINSLASSEPEQAASYIQSLEKSFGKEFQGVVAEMVRDGSLNGSMNLAVLNPNPKAKASILSNLKNGSEIMESFKKSASFSSSKKKELRKAVARSIDPFVRSVTAQNTFGGNSRIANEYADLVEIEAAKILLNNRSLSNSEAVSKAMSLITDSYENVSVGRSNVILPRNKNVDSNIVDSFLDVYQGDSESISKFNPKVPNKFFEKTKQGLQSIGEKASAAVIQRRYNELLEDEGFWVSNPDHSGVVLMVTDVATGRPIQQRNKDGDVIEVLFEDMVKDQNVTEHMNSWF